jgi:hypothetical protein
MATFRSLLLPHQAATDNFWLEFLVILIIHPPRVLYSMDSDLQILTTLKFLRLEWKFWQILR